ncbi:MAG: hypothetical protein HC862_09095 [Scytonema sp. RU_4_4]|nr:hypothetical protein [Scytonema sp. RU_4_4]
MAVCVESDVYLAHKHYDQADQALVLAIALEERLFWSITLVCPEGSL